MAVMCIGADLEGREGRLNGGREGKRRRCHIYVLKQI